MNNKLSLKIAIAHVCTFAVTSSFAYLPDNLNNHQRWYSELSATFMQPSNIDYNESLAGPVPGPIPTLVKTNYQAGVNVLLGYFLTQQDDLSLNYAYNNFKDSHSSADDTPYTNEVNNFITSETTKYSVNYNALDLSLGHTIQKQRWNIHLTGSLDYTRVERQLNRDSAKRDGTAFDNGTPAASYFFEQSSVFNGIGPQFGVELGFKAQEHINLVGGVSLAVLMSTLSMNGEANDPEGIGSTEVRSLGLPSIYTAALKTQAKIGLAYATTLKNSYPFSVELGYKGIFLQNQISDPESLGNSFSMHGPYLGIGLSG